MELNVYRLLLPEGTLDYFDVVDVKERVNEIVIYLEEKNLVPEQYSGEATECQVRMELQQKSGSFAWILVDSWTDRQDGTRASVSETVSVTPGETYRVKAVVTVWAGSDAETATIYSETATA